MNSSATVTIGLPVYNNERFISTMLESVLAQDYSDFLLLICDDCSTDSTEEICREYADRDRRIRYIRNEQNLGPLENHRKVLDLAESEYFMFARGHEILPQDLFSCAMKVLSENKEVVLANAPTLWIDEEGTVQNDKHLLQYDTRKNGIANRCRKILLGKCESFYGIGLTQHFRSVRVLEPVVGTDLIMLMEMGLLGSFAVVPSGNRLRRHYYTEDYGERIKRHSSALAIDPDFLDRHFPILKIPFQLLYSVWHGKIRFYEKILASVVIILMSPIKYLLSIGKTQ
ncbi:MAG: glycosyltransferase [Pseudomonadales bacterium]|nr:glycosyltransferase [Pseudomonadales bacterium]